MHVVPQLPQFARSLLRLLQTPPQDVSFLGHVHDPPWQEDPPEHTVPQSPQFVLSLCVSTQLPWQ